MMNIDDMSEDEMLEEIETLIDTESYGLSIERTVRISFEGRSGQTKTLEMPEDDYGALVIRGHAQFLSNMGEDLIREVLLDMLHAVEATDETPDVYTNVVDLFDHS